MDVSAVVLEAVSRDVRGNGPTDLIGAQVAEVAHDYDWGLVLKLTDGRRVVVEGVWHNDSTSGTDVTVLPALGESDEDRLYAAGYYCAFDGLWRHVCQGNRPSRPIAAALAELNA